MKLLVVSDLHLEFGDIDLGNPGVDVLVLSGDIQAKKLQQDFFKRVSDNFPHVVYVPGNHEYYDSEFFSTNTRLRKFCQEFPNVHYLPEGPKVIDGVQFVGDTIWADANGNDEETKRQLRGLMNDFQIIRIEKSIEEEFNQRAFTPDDMVSFHRAQVEEIRTVLSESALPTVVVGHHAPSKASTHPRYAKDIHMNGGYSSDLTKVILDNPQIKLWTHGHTHESFDYMVGGTRIVCNPRGYKNYQENPKFDPKKIIEVAALDKEPKE
jgi:predicted phosphodiesterase